MKHLVTVLALILLAGCSSTREITQMEPYLTPQELEQPNHQTIDKIKHHYFTEEAYQIIKKIPAIDGPAIGGYSAGVNIWSNIASFLTCNGIGRKIIVPKDSIALWGVSILIHEYTHHLDDIDRDGEGEFIDHTEFRNAYLLMAHDMKWRGLYLWAEEQSQRMVTEVFGIGELSEQIAYVAQHIATKNGPDYMKFVFRKILKLEFPSVTMYTDTHGVHSLIDLKDPDDKE